MGTKGSFSPLSEDRHPRDFLSRVPADVTIGITDFVTKSLGCVVPKELDPCKVFTLGNAHFLMTFRDAGR